MGEQSCIFLTLQAEFANIHARERPFPYDVTATLVATDGGVADTFGAYLHCIPAGTYNFGGVHNRINIRSICVENMSANETFVLEFYRSPDGVVFHPIGAIRFIRAAPQLKSFTLMVATRPFCNTHNGLYARLKDSAGAGTTVTFSLVVSSFSPAVPNIPQTPGVWPFG